MFNAFDYNYNRDTVESQQNFVDGSRFIPTGKPDFDTDFTPNRKFFDVEIRNFEIVRKPLVPQSLDVAKILLRQRITGQSGLGEFIPPELHLTDEEIRENQFKYQENIVSVCGHQAISLKGETSGADYIKLIDCHKQWCPHCGGKKGKIHKNRIRSILKRVDLSKYSLRQLIFTIPEHIREDLKNRESLDKLFAIVKRIISKFYGQPIFDRRGHIKSYKLNKGVILYLHVFGDPKRDEKGNFVYDGKFHPHINVHVFEPAGTLMKQQSSIIESIKSMWLKQLNKTFSLNLSVVDMQYLFKIKMGQKVHAVKYMSKPWCREDYLAADDDLKRLLVLDLTGFLYVRFYGSLANCNYKDEMILSEDENEEIESKVGERLIKFGNIGLFDLERWCDKIELIGDGLYRIRSRIYERKTG